MKDKMLIKALFNESIRLGKIIDHSAKVISKSPEGNLRINKNQNKVQFYLRIDPREKNGKYIPKSENEKVYALIQKKYLEKIKSVAIYQKKTIDSFLTKYDPDALNKVFYKEGAIRQKYIKPVVITDEQYVHEWKLHKYEQKRILDDSPQHYTRKHERVRSKSEVIIANTLDALDIPYRYECELQLGNNTIHPDFTLLRVEDRQEIYWEHLGMLDDMEYRNNAMRRIRLYEENGIYVGDRLLLSFETYKMPLNTLIVERMVKHYFKNR